MSISEAQRIQLRRTKGWRKPEGAIVVARPTAWGNPWKEGDPHPTQWRLMSRQEAVDLYRVWITDALAEGSEPPISDLRGHDLACWCRLDQPCHADVLLELANAR